jgi:hypothetical protein
MDVVADLIAEYVGYDFNPVVNKSVEVGSPGAKAIAQHGNKPSKVKK